MIGEPIEGVYNVTRIKGWISWKFESEKDRRSARAVIMAHSEQDADGIHFGISRLLGRGDRFKADGNGFIPAEIVRALGKKGWDGH